MVTKIKLSFILVALLSAVTFSLEAMAKEKVDVFLPEITGRLTDEKRQPIPDAQVTLSDEKGDLLESVESDANGSFVLPHQPCVTCDLEVVPATKTGFASALIENIPGTITRRFLFTLQKGFKVKGRVVFQNHGLKNLSVKVVSADPEDEGHVHSGGATRTSRDGSFELTLTPGKKLLTVKNNKYEKASSRFEKSFAVTSDATLSDIKLDDTNLKTSH